MRTEPTDRERDLLARANRISRICDELVAEDGVPSGVLMEIYAYADSLRVLASNPSSGQVRGK